MDFVPDFETKVKYRRSSIVPDYRHSFFAGEPNNVNLAVNGTNGESSRPKSELPVFAPKVEAENGSSSWRNSDLPVFAKANGLAPKRSETFAVQRRSESPEPGVSRVMSFPANRSGAISPVTHRSISPVGFRSGAVSPVVTRNGAVSPITTRHGAVSPATTRNGAVSPITGSSTPAYRNSSPMARDRSSLTQQQTQSAEQLRLKAAARRQVQSLTLDTLMTQRPETSASDGSEETEEVISLSPAVRAPVKKFRRQSSAMGMSAFPDASNPTLDSILENGKSYFGQDVNPEDLVAVNLENAFDRL